VYASSEMSRGMPINCRQQLQSSVKHSLNV
jgi:hypothetical protein